MKRTIFGFLFAIVALLLPSAKTFAATVPPSSIPSSNYLVGAFYYPAWHLDAFDEASYGWLYLSNFPGHKPLLGYYNDDNPEVTDWQIKWAVEHGVNFFIFDWSRCDNTGKTSKCDDILGKPIETARLPRYEALHKGFLQAQLRDKMKFTIMLNGLQGYSASISTLDDLRNNLMPYIINTYFKNPSYLVIDNKPVLYVWDDSIIKTADTAFSQQAVAIMRQEAKASGFADLILMGHSWQFVNRSLYDIQKLKECGYDYQFSYVTPVADAGASPTEQQAIESQKQSYEFQLANAPIPFIVTASPFWDTYPFSPSPGTSHYNISPQGYETVINNAKAIMNQESADLGRRMIILDAWNEFVEGHYIAPDVRNGFGFLNAARNTLTNKDNTPDERVPAGLGMGPYDSLYKQYVIDHQKEYSEVSTHTYTFNSPNEFIDVQNVGFTIEDTDKLTFGGWVKPALTSDNYFPFATDYRARVALGKDGGGHCAIATKNNGWYSDGTTVTWPSGKITANTWHQIICIYNGSNLTAYIDGVKMGTSSPTISGTIYIRSTLLRLGYSPDNWYPASIANFVFTNTALTDEDVQSLYQTSRPDLPPGDLNNDGKVDIFDYNLLVDNFGKTGSNLQGDINRNGKVDIFDYNQLVGNFGK